MAKSELITRLEEYFKNTPREQVLKDWEETKKATAGIISPTVEEFMGWQGIRVDHKDKAPALKVQAMVIEPVKIFFLAESYDEKTTASVCC